MAKANSSGGTNNPLERWDAIRLGTSSLTSESRPDRSGTSGTTGLPSPAPSVDSLSSPDPLASQAQSSTAPSKDGSGQETTSTPASPLDSSEDSAALKEVTLDQVLEAEHVSAGTGEVMVGVEHPADGTMSPTIIADPYAGLSGYEAMEMARKEYAEGNYDEAERLLAVSENRGENPANVARARGYIAEARTRALGAAPSDSEASGGAAAGPSEEDPAAGGFLVP